MNCACRTVACQTLAFTKTNNHLIDERKKANNRVNNQLLK
jgi:hypothetical protein